MIITIEMARRLEAVTAAAEEAKARVAQRNARVKPYLRRVFNVEDADYEWRCSDSSECYAMGWGATPEAAYEQWLSRFAHCRRSRAE